MSAICWSDQYEKPCVIPHPAEDAQDVIDRCREIGAVLYHDGEEFIVELRKDVGPEAWTESALRRSLK